MKTTVKKLSLLPTLIVSLSLILRGPVTAQTFTVLHTFTAENSFGYNSDGANLAAGLILSGSTLYGTAEYGGSSGGGTVFAVNTNGLDFTTLHNFTTGNIEGYNSDGANPEAGLVLSGNTLYGTASYGGSLGYGTVFAVNTNGTGFRTLYSFTGGNDGGLPEAGLILSGNTLYGTASGTMSLGGNNYGTVFSINTNGTGFRTLYRFTGGSDGGASVAGLILSGNTLYGTASGGGSFNDGTVFSINTNGTGFKSLYSFTGGNDGGDPVAGLILSGPALYGTSSGGNAVQGAVFAINTNGAGFRILYSFTSGSDGDSPRAGLILSGKTLYGTTYSGGASIFSTSGTIFAVNTNGTDFSTLYNFSALSGHGYPEKNSDGGSPVAGLILSGSTVYGATFAGGSFGGGTVFALDFTPPSTMQPMQRYKDIGCLPCQAALADPGVGDPIRLGNGNIFEEVTDCQTAGVNTLGFTRYYNSLGDTNTPAVLLGGNWRSSYDRYLRIINGFVVAERADAQQLQFTNIGSGWISDSDVDIKLVQSGSTWMLTNSDDTVETYNTSGLLASIQSRDGYTQTLQYNGGNQLMSVSDSFGRTLQLAYQSNLLQMVTTPDGLVLTYGYTSSGVNPGVFDRLASVSYSTTPQTSQSYLYENANLPFALTGIIDENSNRFATWTYDSSGRAISSQHAGGADLTLVGYNDNDGSRSLTNALGLVTVYKFTTMQGVSKNTEIDRLATTTTPAAVMTQTYDSNGYLASFTDWNTNVTSMINDIHDQPLVVNEGVGTLQARTTTNGYLSNFHLPAQIATPRKITAFMYDTNGNMLTRTETDTSIGTVPYSTSGQTRTWSNTYDNLGHVLTATGPRTDVIATTVFTYDVTDDGSNNVSTITDPLGHVTLLTNYNGSGLPLTMIDPNNVTTAFTYDARDSLLTRTVQAASGNATTTFGYDAAEQLTSITLPDGSRLNYAYDAAHRLVSVSNILGESIVYTLDAAGNIAQQNTRNSGAAIVRTQSGVFDQLSRMLQHIGAYSESTTYGYDSDGNLTLIADGLTNTTLRAFDALNRLVTSIDPLRNSTGYAHDPQDNVISVTDPRSLVTSYVYDGFRRVIQESSPDKGTTVYTLDLAGNRVSETDARGEVTQRTFDKLNRVTTETFPASPGENITYSYDATGGGNKGIGRLAGYTDETGSTTLTYNERGDVVSATRLIGGKNYTTAYGYDLADHVISITYPSGDIINYTRDTQGRINAVSYLPGGSGSPVSLAANVTYMPFGPVSGLVYGNGLARPQNYDLDYRLTGIKTSAPGANVQNLTLGYDAVNDMITITDNLATANSQTFKYDEDYRLTQAFGVYGYLGYTYDADGNRLTSTAGNGTQTYNYSQAANMLQSTVASGVTRNLAYTANGNLSSDNRGTTSTLVFNYGNRNRYNALYSGASTVATYQHNALGERLIKTVGGTTTHYHYDQQGHLIAESQSSGTLIREYVWLDDMPLAQIEASGAVYYIHPDHLNTPQKMTDATHAIVWSNEEQPFAETVPPSLTSIGFNASKQFQITVNGGPNYNYVVQTSANLSAATWVSITTNGAPFTFTDTSASTSGARFYRVVSISSSINPVGVTMNLRFPGQYYDSESGLNYNMHRDYDPTLGRYIQSDPIGLQGGINVYAYADANPLSKYDIAGLSSDIPAGLPSSAPCNFINGRLPSFNLPTFTLPTFTLPTLTLPTLTLQPLILQPLILQPLILQPLILHPLILPTFTLPTFTLPTFTLPTFTLPTFSLP